MAALFHVPNQDPDLCLRILASAGATTQLSWRTGIRDVIVLQSRSVLALREDLQAAMTFV
jgi:hypothetical protein